MHDSGYNIFVAGKEITKNNADDVLGDGTVYYDIYNNILTFDNATIECESTGICKGLNISGDLYLGKDTSLDVSIDDESTELGECIRVSGLMEVVIDSTVTASAKNAYAVECFGAIEANEGAVISAVSDKKDADIFCSGAIVNYGATVNAEADALGGIHNKAEGAE